jgi:hypothetical protein
MALFALAATSLLQASQDASFPFITRDGDRLMEGDREFRFISINHPNLHISENPTWRRMTPWEQEDGIRSIAQMGGQVVRIYTLSVKGGRRNGDGLSHIRGPKDYDEELLRDFDQVVALCGKHKVRLIIPFIDEWDWFGGIGEFAALHGKPKEAFYTDPEVMASFRDVVKMLVTRVNTVTGIPYNEDPTIMVWESGNELRDDPEQWVCELGAYVKELAPRQLFQDGHCGVRPMPLADANVDLLTNHYYGRYDFAEAARKHREETKGRKPFYVGEYDPRNTGNLLEEVISNGLAGAMAWGLRGHAAEGGYFCHFDPLYYHWPHSPVTRQLRKAAYAIQGLPEPLMEVPDAPELIHSTNPRKLTWRGSTGAETYTLERALSEEGPWTVVAEGIRDNRCSGETLFDDEGAPNVWPIFYRLKAANESGESPYSPIMRCGR